MKKKNKGFTLIELLCVIVILGLLIAIAVPTITNFITTSRKKTLVNTINQYMDAVAIQVNNMEYYFTGTKVSYGSQRLPLIYAVPIECIDLEGGGKNPFGEWYRANPNYFAYVLVQYDEATSKYTYGFTFKDSAGYGMYPTVRTEIDSKGSQIKTKLYINQPTSGSIQNTTAAINWRSWNVTNANYIQVLTPAPNGNKGNGITTCTLQQKGKNNDIIEKEEDIKDNQDDYTIIGIEANTEIAFWKYRKYIRNVTIQDSINIPASVGDNYQWDVSITGKGKVMAYVVPNAKEAAYFDLFIQGDGKVFANPDSSFLFDEFRYLDQVDLGNFDTSRVTDMSGMFYAAGYHTPTFKINLGNNFDTSNVINMNQIFNQMGYKSTNFTLDLGDKFDTSKVTDMYKAFWKTGYNSTVFTIDLGNKFDTSNVTRMNYMFGNMGFSSTVITLDLGDKFNTSNVTEMPEMFQSIGNNSPSFYLDCSAWDVSKVTNYKNFYTGAGNKIIQPTWPTA